MPSPSEWIHQATCANPHYIPAWWDCDGNVLTSDNHIAVALCNKCPVREQCKTETRAQPGLYQGTIRHGEPVPTPSALAKRRQHKKTNDE